MLYDFNGTGQSDVAFGNKADIIETRTNNRIRPIHFGVNYHSSPLQFKLVFGSEEALDRYEMQAVAMWLTGYQNYQWLTIDQPDLGNVQFRCLITELTPLSVGWLPYAFQATVTCDCPYAYGYPFEKTYSLSGSDDGDQIVFYNDSTVREYVKPELSYTGGSGTLSIVNASDNDREFKLENLVSSYVVSIDNKNGIITEKTGVNLYGGFGLNFFRLVPGDNVLTIKGDGKLTISGQFLYNVAG
jgi:phage-related protein